MKQIAFTEEYLNKFSVSPEPTLFGPDWSMLKLNRCPHCTAKLKFPLHRNIALCNSKRHGKPFVISKSKLR